MIKKSEEMLKEIKEQLRGGKGEVEFKHIFMQDELKGKCRLMAQLTLNPGSSIGFHEHVNEEEVYFITEGAGIADDNGTKREIKAGDAMLTGDGAAHAIENTGDVPLKMIAIVLLY